MSTYYYRFTPARKLSANTTRMATVEVYDLNLKKVDSYSWSYIPKDKALKEQFIQQGVDMLIREHELAKVWRKLK